MVINKIDDTQCGLNIHSSNLSFCYVKSLIGNTFMNGPFCTLSCEITGGKLRYNALWGRNSHVLGYIWGNDDITGILLGNMVILWDWLGIRSEMVILFIGFFQKMSCLALQKNWSRFCSMLAGCSFWRPLSLIEWLKTNWNHPLLHTEGVFFFQRQFFHDHHRSWEISQRCHRQD